MTASDLYQVEVEDFGPVREAKVAIRPLTVFVGPSNSGKSYLAILIYALHSYFRQIRTLASFGPAWEIPVPDYHPSQWSVPAGAKDLEDIVQATATSDHKELRQWLETVVAPSAKPGFSWPPLPEAISSLVRQCLQEHAEMANDCRLEIMRCFGVQDFQNLIRWSSHDGIARLRLQTQSTDPSRSVSLHMTLAVERDPLACEIPNTLPLSATPEQFGVVSHHWSSGMLRWIHGEDNESHTSFPALSETCAGWLNHMTASVMRNLWLPLCLHRAYYLPADRAGLMHSYPAIVHSLLQGENTIPSGVLRDYLAQLTGLSIAGRIGAQFPGEGIARQLEEDILEGKVTVDSSQSRIPQFLFGQLGAQAQIPLTLASSMVSELAPMALFLEKRIQPQDFLIIEEPESHLHPAAQAELARMLVRLVQNEVRVIITTHSDWLLDQLGNLVRFSQLPTGQNNGLSLSPEQMGVWLFQSQAESQGTVVQEIKYDDESGTYPVGFGDVAVALYNEWADAANKIEEQKEDDRN